ncbi:hypothetical protein H2684_04945 [Clostridium sp. cel8]|jgi:hypothetical protein|uniref:hypothetical protein n=1 Tax=unclassified Clostridium TaxID=2614128 RepID=UPI0015F736FF|nr:hypothetical protein [Clostridium sp. cel8]MBA5850668.1 hypothetical protein [Clostridium sp. cel8]
MYRYPNSGYDYTPYEYYGMPFLYPSMPVVFSVDPYMMQNYYMMNQGIIPPYMPCVPADYRQKVTYPFPRQEMNKNVSNSDYNFKGKDEDELVNKKSRGYSDINKSCKDKTYREDSSINETLEDEFPENFQDLRMKTVDISEIRD